MKFLVDESADIRLAAFLTSLGHDATTVVHNYTPALRDTEILAIAHREGRVLITNDRDFGELAFRYRQPHTGIIFLRLATTRLDAKIERLNHVLTHHATRLEQFLVVTPHTVRVRPTSQF